MSLKEQLLSNPEIIWEYLLIKNSFGKITMDCLITTHALFRMKQRGITKQNVLDTIKYPDFVLKKHGKFYAQKNIGTGILEVPYEKTTKYIKIITVYWI